jgi:hypothetical protein
MSTRDNAPTGRNQQLQNGESMREEWEGVEDSPSHQWGEMKKRHEKELAELQTAQAKAVISLVAQHMAERDQLKKGN